ncbi:MAG: twin-arginine translocation signal domain-containing protein, partial [bacterium]
MTTERTPTSHLSRRDALRLLGTGAAGAGLGLTAGCESGGAPEAVSEPPPGGAAVVFPEGAIVRTLLADIDPAALDTGATLFHEHLAFDFSSPPPEPRAPGTPPPPLPTNEAMVDLLVDELRMAAFDGVSCI